MGYEGRGRNGEFTPAQIGQIRRLLDEYTLEKRVYQRRHYYRGSRR
jgi:hypothetical protein